MLEREGFTEDWAVIEINNSKVDLTSFVGNVIDLSTIPINKFIAWMFSRLANLPSFKYPQNCLLKFYGTILVEEM